MPAKWILGPLLALLASSCLAAAPLRVANWNDYIDPEVLTDFTRETGIPVEYQTYEDDQTVYNMLKSGTALDIVVPSTDNFGRLVREKLLIPIDSKSLTSLRSMDSLVTMRLKMHDPEMTHGIPYLWGSIGLAVNVPKVEAALGGPMPKSWGLLFNKENLQKLGTCGVTLLDSSNDVVNILMYYRGASLSAGSTGDIRRSLEYLEEIWPLYTYVDSERYIDDIRNGDVCLSMAWEGDARAASHDNPDVQYISPEEGSATFLDIVAIPASVQNREGAQAFIAYLQRPEVAARIAAYTQYHTPNLAAQQLLEQRGEMSAEEARLKLSQLTYQSPRPDVQIQIAQLWARLMGE